MSIRIVVHWLMSEPKTNWKSYKCVSVSSEIETDVKVKKI